MLTQLCSQSVLIIPNGTANKYLITLLDHYVLEPVVLEGFRAELDVLVADVGEDGSVGTQLLFDLGGVVQGHLAGFGDDGALDVLEDHDVVDALRTLVGLRVQTLLQGLLKNQRTEQIMTLRHLPKQSFYLLTLVSFHFLI